jgi:hypothetical protein
LVEIAQPEEAADKRWFLDRFFGDAEEMENSRLKMMLLKCSMLRLGGRSAAICRWLSPAGGAQYSALKAESTGHVPVLLQHVVSLLNPAAGERVIDCTAGLGGHAAAIAQRLGPSGSISLLDADASNLQVASHRVRSSVPIENGPSVQVHHMNFRNIARVAPQGSVDIIIADLGVCSSQIDNLSRGFSFRTNTKSANLHPLTDMDAPLDMRFDQSPTSSCVPVSDWLRRTKTLDVADALMTLGEVRPSAARRIAAAIEANSPVTSTKQLRDIVVRQTGEVQPPLAQVCLCMPIFSFSCGPYPYLLRRYFRLCEWS